MLVPAQQPAVAINTWEKAIINTQVGTTKKWFLRPERWYSRCGIIIGPILYRKDYLQKQPAETEKLHSYATFPSSENQNPTSTRIFHKHLRKPRQDSSQGNITTQYYLHPKANILKNTTG